MPTDVVMPQMGESIFEGTITKWLKKTGDAVQKDEPLFEISTDKVDAEIPSPVAGVLTEIKALEGTTVEVNTVVAVIAEGSTGKSEQKSEMSASLNPDVPRAVKSAPAEGARQQARGGCARGRRLLIADRIVMPQMGEYALGSSRDCKCGSALAHAIVTDRKAIPAAAKKRLAPIAGKYIS